MVTVMGGWEQPLDTIYRQSSLMPRSQLIDNSLENPTLSLLSQGDSRMFCIHGVSFILDWLHQGFLQAIEDINVLWLLQTWGVQE